MEVQLEVFVIEVLGLKDLDELAEDLDPNDLILILQNCPQDGFELLFCKTLHSIPRYQRVIDILTQPVRESLVISGILPKRKDVRIDLRDELV